jgi:hypothetical protein
MCGFSDVNMHASIINRSEGSNGIGGSAKTGFWPITNRTAEIKIVLNRIATLSSGNFTDSSNY